MKKSTSINSKLGYKNFDKFRFLKNLKKEHPQAEVYLVGGSVRDLLLKNKITDVDLVVRGIPAKQLAKTLKKHGAVRLVGQRFGVFKFRAHQCKMSNVKCQMSLDIALPRTDRSWGTGGYQDFEVQSDPKLPLEDDLKRRDFTINAMAISLRSQQQLTINNQQLTLIDPFKGATDLRKKIIRTVGKPEERFKEDYSRMLRAIRFACKLDFAIERKTWAAIKKLQKNILKIPKEAVAIELKKMFKTNPILALKLLDKSGFLHSLIPELLQMKNCPQPKNYHSEGNVWKHTLVALKVLKEKRVQDIETILAVLFHDLGKPYTIKRPADQDYPKPKKGARRIKFPGHDKFGASQTRRILKRLKMSSAKINVSEVVWLAKNHMLPFFIDLKTVKNTTLEKYFFNEKYSGEKLLTVMSCDSMASIELKTSKPNLAKLRALKQKVKQLEKIHQTKKEPRKTLLNGYQVMKILKLEPGPRVGEILEKLREEELAGKVRTKKEARKWIGNSQICLTTRLFDISSQA